MDYRTPGSDLGLLAGGGESQSVVVMSFYLRTGGRGRHMCRFTYIRVDISRLLILLYIDTSSDVGLYRGDRD